MRAVRQPYALVVFRNMAACMPEFYCIAQIWEFKSGGGIKYATSWRGKKVVGLSLGRIINKKARFCKRAGKVVRK